jgi:hypothetical protein
MIKKIQDLNLHILMVYLLLVFPMFYYVYKFGVLLMGYDDVKWYLKLYANLGDPEVPSPFNMRLISATCIHYMDKLGLMYNTECSIDMYPLVNKRIFFNSIFFNFFCITATSFSLFTIFVKLGFSRIKAFLAGTVYLLGFGTIFYLMMPGPDAMSVLIFTWVVYFYVKKSYWMLPFFAALILQREYYFLAFMVVTLMDFFKYGKTRYYLVTFLASVSFFLVYFFLRKTVFHTNHWSHQTKPEFLWATLWENDLQLVPLIKQSLMTMNVYLIYIFILVYKKVKGFSINRHHLFVTLVLLAEITMLSFAATFGTNNGRYFYLNLPLFLYYILVELKPFNVTLSASIEDKENESML